MLLETGLLYLKKSFLPSIALILAIIHHSTPLLRLSNNNNLVVWDFDLKLVVVFSYHEQR